MEPATDLKRDLAAVEAWLRTRPEGQGVHLVALRHPRQGPRAFAHLIVAGLEDPVLRQRLRVTASLALLDLGCTILLVPVGAGGKAYPWSLAGLSAHERLAKVMCVERARVTA